MASTINGIGTWICPARGFTNIQGGEGPDYDAVECFVFFYLPLIPLRPIHAHSWCGNRYQEVSIPWSWDLVLAAFGRRWAMGLIVVGLIFGVILGLEPESKAGASGMGVTEVAVAVAAGIALLAAFEHADQKQRQIRRVMGHHALGTSDPATWDSDILAKVPLSMELFGTPSDSSAVPALLEKKEFGQAMFAARLTAAREDRGAGEAMTEKILRDPAARASAERNPKVGFWATLFS